MNVAAPEQIDIALVHYVPNPFYAGHLRNKLCPCMSGKKLKRCHGSANRIHKDALEKLMIVLETNAATEQQL